MCKGQLIPCDCALDHASDGLGTWVGALADARFANLKFAGVDARGDVGTTLGFADRAVFKDQVAEEPGRTVVPVWSNPLLSKFRTVCIRACAVGRVPGV